MASPYDDPVREGQAPCADGCGRGLWWTGRGRRPTKCPSCAGQKPRHSKKKRLVPVPADSSHQTKVRASRARGEARSAIASNEFAALRLAVGLGLAPDDPERAARLAGVVLPGSDGKPRAPERAELDELVAQVGPEHQGIIEGREQSLVQLLTRFGMLNAISLLEQEPLLAPKERPFAGRMAQQIVKDLGGQRLIFSGINIILGRPRAKAAK